MTLTNALRGMVLVLSAIVLNCGAPLCEGTGECDVGDVCVRPITGQKGVCAQDRCTDPAWNKCLNGQSCTDSGGALPLCFDPVNPVDPCATDNGGCGDPTTFTCVFVPGSIQCIRKDAAPCTTDNACGDSMFCADTSPRACFNRLPVGTVGCTRDRACVASAICAPTVVQSQTIGKCELPVTVPCTADNVGSCTWASQFCNGSMSCENKRADGQACTRPAMCASNVCTIPSGSTSGTCGIPGTACNGDDLGQGCDVAFQYCNLSMRCEAKRNGGEICQKDTWCKSASCVKSVGQVEGVCADYHPTNCKANSLTIMGPANLKCYGLVGQKKGALLYPVSGAPIPAPVGTWDASGNFAKSGTTLQYCLSDWAPHFNCCAGNDCGTTGPDQKWLVNINSNLDPATLAVDPTVATLPANTCRPVKSSTGGNMLCDLK